MKKYSSVCQYSIFLLLIIVCIAKPAVAQYSISGGTCVASSATVAPYLVSGGPISTADKWCITNGTVTNSVGSSSTCLASDGNAGVSVTWGNSGTGTLSYYHPATAGSPSATLSVTINSANSVINGQTLYAPSGIAITFSITGNSMSGCGSPFTYTLQSATPSIFSSLQTSSTPNFTVTGTFTGSTPTVYREAVTTSSMSGTAYSPSSVVVVPFPAFTPGAITPAGASIDYNSSPGTLTSAAASSGSCGPTGFTYQWQSSTDNITWNNVSGATSLSYTPGNQLQDAYFRLKITQTCNPLSMYSSVVLSSIVDRNYVRTRTITKPGVTDTVTAAGLTSPYDVQQVNQYFDGLGRHMQTVARQASPLQYDLVSMQVYDGFGREVNKFLPYVSPSNTGSYKVNAATEQNSFNSAQFPGEQYYYDSVTYEASPLNRVLVNYAPGLSWVGGTRGVTRQYLYNTASDSVQIWNIGQTPGSIPTDSGAYAPGQLYKDVTIDEQGRQVLEYKNKQGQVILKKAQLASSPGTAHVGWICTYYVYDDLSNLRFVIQPRGVELINGTWTISQAIANELCFRYEYDQRKRMVIKKIPGAGESWMVYDARDRVVMSQDSNLRVQGKWMVTEFDSLNRPWRSGLLTDANTRAYHQNLAFSSINYPNTSANYEVLTQTYYDNYTAISSAAPALGSSLASTYIGNSNYYITSYGSSPTYALAISPWTNILGLPAGSMTKVIGSSPSQYIYSENIYDDHGRVIQTKSLNYTGAVDTLTTQYNFNGKPLRIFLNHQKSGNTAQHHNVLTKLDYDAGFRVIHMWKNIDGAASDQLIDSMQYNELGQLRAKYLGNKMDSLVYDYGIRGWLIGINRSYVGAMTSHYFGMELAYDKTSSIVGSTTYTNPIFNGNIAGVTWRSAGDGVNRKYDYSYDNLNRLTSAAYKDDKAGSWGTTAMDYSVNNLSYDANGNLMSMNQHGFKVGGSALIDSLIYTYQTVSNKLSQVIDAVNDSMSKLGDFHYKPATKGSFDYSYDGNGNLVLDNNKAIDHIHYNYLNLPDTVHINTKGKIIYTYDAVGNKLNKLTLDSTVRHSTTTLYLDGFVYQQNDSIINPGGGVDTLQIIGHEEGRARWAYHVYTSGSPGYKWEYDFFEKDHLGNTRMVLSQQRDTAQYVATMEAAYRATENQLFYNIATSSYRRANISGYPTDNTTTPNDSVARVNGSGQKIGPAIILKVMSGDTIDIACKSFYASQTGTGTNPSINDVMNSLANGLVNMTGGAKGTLSQLNNSGGPLYTALSSFMTANNQTTSGQPRAYLNWILLDNQFNYVSSYPQSGAVPVSNFTMGVLGNPGYSGIPITKSGYLYIYVSNETQGWDVFFDNLSVRQRSGPMLEENHYYPFGLTMAGIADKALKVKYAPNKYQFNSKELQNNEFSDGSGLEEYDFGARMLDPQIGRWMTIDQLSEKYYSLSPYCFAANDPISNIDVDGREIIVTKYKPYFGEKLQNLKLPFVPKTIHEFGVTGIVKFGTQTGIAYHKNKDNSYTVNADIGILINPNLAPGGILQSKNPGLEKEVEAHEQSHADQLEEAIKSKLTIESGFTEKANGKTTRIQFTGTIDEILGQADREYDLVKSKNPDAVKKLTKERYINTILNEAVNAIYGKMPSNVEDDANNRAATKLGGKSNMPYTTGVYPIQW